MLGEFIALLWTFKMTWKRYGFASSAYGRGQTLTGVIQRNGKSNVPCSLNQSSSSLSQPGIACFLLVVLSDLVVYSNRC